MEIRVTRADLKGEYVDPYDCPIARAVIRAFPGSPVSVWPRTVFIGHDSYFLSEGANKKALRRARTLWGKIVGGFTINLIKT
jgi:hypothetical protein